MKKYWIVLNSLLFLLLPCNHVNGCGWNMSPEEYRFFLLQPDITNSNGLGPFFYSPEIYNAYYPGDDRMIEVNAKEWKAHTHYKGSWKEIAEVIYTLSTEDYLNKLDSLKKKHPFISHLSKKYKPELEYLTYARKCELMINNTDPWRLNNDYGADTTLVSACATEGLKLYNTSGNEFLKLRTAYQLLKLSFYHPGFSEELDAIYETKIKPLSIQSWIKASAFFYTIQNDQYKLSLCFDRSIDKRFRCVQLFDRKNIQRILPFAKSNHEKAVMWVMYELQNATRSLSGIEKIYNLDPNNKDLPMLLSREINKVEDWLMTPQLTGQSASILAYSWDNEQTEILKRRRLSDKNYVHALYIFMCKVIREKKQDDPALWNVLASYLCILDGNFKEAGNHLTEANTFKQTDKVTFQVKLNQLLLNLNSAQTLSPELEKQILGFCDFSNRHPDIFYKQDIMINQLYLYIGKHLIHHKDVAKGIFFLSKTNRVIGTISYWTYKTFLIEMLEHAKAKDYDEMLTIIDKKNKTPFEKFLTTRKVTRSDYYDSYYYEDYSTVSDTAAIDKNKVLDYKSMYYVQQDLLDSALLTVNQIPSSYWKSSPYDLFQCFPFSITASLDHQSNHDFYIYNKRQYLQRMCDIKILIKNNIGDIAKHYYVLANGYFNMSYHGNFWIMNMPYKLCDEVSNNYYDIQITNKLLANNYYGCQLAQENYLNAMRLSTDTAFGALCAARASVCNIHLQEINWRANNIYNEKDYSWTKEFKPTYSVFENLFVNQFKIKDYYQDFVSNCYNYEHTKSNYY